VNPVAIAPQSLLAGLREDESPAPIEEAVWYEAEAVGDGLSYRFDAGTLSGAEHLWADMLLDGATLTVFQLRLQEGEDGPTFTLNFAALNQCSARIRMPLGAVDQNRWMLGREGAWLKPMCGGDRVDPAKVDRMELVVLRKADKPVRWCLTPFQAGRADLLEEPILPQGPLLDALGQSTLHVWPSKTPDSDALVKSLLRQREKADDWEWPEGFSDWGGWREHRVKAKGYFQTHHDGDRWWLVDPAGYLFWSAGQDCVRSGITTDCRGLEAALTWVPDGECATTVERDESGVRSVNYLAANFIRAFGDERWHDEWAATALGELRRAGFNTVANWSEWEIACEDGFPYVRPLSLRLTRTPTVFRDFPDVFDPAFEQDAADFAEQLRETAGDPALIGYFLMNEPTWGFARQTPAEGMLLNTPSCATRRRLAEHLRERYGDDAALAKAWGVETSFDDVGGGEWRQPLNDAARADLEAFSTVMGERLFTVLSDACRAVDPNHLNLGARYYTVPPAWALEGMRCFDVFSINGYAERVPAEAGERIAETLDVPVLVGEWHFGALDVGLPGSGIGRVRNQVERGRAYRVYLEDAASKPWCVGVHHFTFYDQSALGRPDGENYNIGFYDVCNRPYTALVDAARESHERVYPVAAGYIEPFDDPPEYLPKLFM
jgi:hypothetical protein